MKFQDYSAPKATLGAVAVVAALVPIILAYFLVSGAAQNETFPGLSTGTTTTTSATATPGAQITIVKGASSGEAAAPGYSPDNAVVVLGVNSTVTWTNDDTALHTVTAVNMTAGAPDFDSGAISAGSTYTYNFTAPGVYDYHCDFHTWMSGSITVKTGTPPVHVSILKGASSGANAAPGYGPDVITVVIGVNNTVIWTNDDTALHTVTAVNMTAGAPDFDSGAISAGSTFLWTFTTPGTYDYHCDFHTWMSGTVKVVKGS